MTKILALNSIRGKSGKDTLIGLLESEGRSVFRVAFADILKEECSQILAGGPGTLATTYQRNMHKSVKDKLDVGLSIENIADSSYRHWLMGTINYTGSWETARSLRWHLQQYGTEYKRQFLKDPHVWLKAGLKEIGIGLDSQPDFVVVTDMRLPNEYGQLMTTVPRIHNEFSGIDTKSVRIVRDWFIPGVDDQPYHISDIALMAHPFDGLVVNRLGEPWAMLDQLKDQGVID